MPRILDLLVLCTFALIAAGLSAGDGTSEKKPVPAVLNFTMNSLDGKPVNLSKYQGKVVLMVNTASKCGYTPQYKGLETLHEKYAEKGLAILGFPANDFGKQEPGTDSEIGEFCQKNYGVKFDMFSKVVVHGEGQCPLYKFLTSSETNPEFPGEIKWNFEKFLIGRDGKIVKRFGSKVAPESEEVTKAIEAELAKAVS
jgi:glutathione peroxidase